MPSFIDNQRHNLERLLALILLWNVIAGAFVTLFAPWLAEVAGTTGLRPLLPTGSGWLAIGVPTHFAGLWLSVLGAYALHRMRRHLPWRLAAALFYAPQTFAITSPHIDMWGGMFVASSFQSPAGPTLAVNWIAIVLLLVHTRLPLPNSKLRPYLARTPAVIRGLARDFWGAMPLSRTALSRRYASIATITAILFLPFVPADAIYPPLLLPMTFVAAYVLAFVWSGGQREPCFSAGRGVVAALLSYVYLGMAVDLSSRWFFDGREPLFRLFIIGWIYLLPFILLIPTIGAIAGDRLARNVAAPEEGSRRRFTLWMWLTLITPLLGLLLSYALGAQQRNRIETARAVAHRAPVNFDQNEPEQLYAMFATESQAMTIATPSLRL